MNTLKKILSVFMLVILTACQQSSPSSAIAETPVRPDNSQTGAVTSELLGLYAVSEVRFCQPVNLPACARIKSLALALNNNGSLHLEEMIGHDRYTKDLFHIETIHGGLSLTEDSERFVLLKQDRGVIYRHDLHQNGRDLVVEVLLRKLN